MNRIEELKGIIEAAYKEIEQIQNECVHPEICLTKEHGGNTGNYDPSCDCYWTKYTCGLCDKTWTEEE